MVISPQHFSEMTNGYEKTSSGLWTHRGRLSVLGSVDVAEMGTPTPPAATTVRLYAKADHKLYFLDSSGAEHAVTST